MFFWTTKREWNHTRQNSNKVNFQHEGRILSGIYGSLPLFRWVWWQQPPTTTLVIIMDACINGVNDPFGYKLYNKWCYGRYYLRADEIAPWHRALNWQGKCHERRIVWVLIRCALYRCINTITIVSASLGCRDSYITLVYGKARTRFSLVSSHTKNN